MSDRTVRLWSEGIIELEFDVVALVPSWVPMTIFIFQNLKPQGSGDLFDIILGVELPLNPSNMVATDV